MAGTDIPFLAGETIIHQPTIKEISYIGELEYFSTLQMFCFNRDVILASEANSGLSQYSNFQIFMTLIMNPEVKDRTKRLNDLLSVFTMLFPGFTPQMLPTSIYFNNTTTKQHFVLDENNFDSFRDIMIDISGINNQLGGQNSNYNPKGELAAKIAAKLMRGRDRAAKSKGSHNIDGALAKYVSILTIGLESMSLQDCLNLTIYQLYDLVERLTLYISWDLDIKSRLAGGSPDDQPDDWMKDLH